VRKPTTTTYLILGLLALRRWSTYELAQQMQRTIRYFWPRAESHIYEEPKKLVENGFATATREYAGRRPRTVYAITDEGRDALRAWLEEPGRGPLLEFEGLVKTLFAEQAGKAELLATLATVRDDAERMRQHHAELAAELADTGGPFPERLHVNALVLAFLWEQSEAVLSWLTWAEQEVAGWPDDASRPAGGMAHEVLHRAASFRELRLPAHL
jgi:DNA-binding PadR family transcriptional regulator